MKISETAVKSSAQKPMISRKIDKGPCKILDLVFSRDLLWLESQAM